MSQMIWMQKIKLAKRKIKELIRSCQLIRLILRFGLRCLKIMTPFCLTKIAHSVLNPIQGRNNLKKATMDPVIENMYQFKKMKMIRMNNLIEKKVANRLRISFRLIKKWFLREKRVVPLELVNLVQKNNLRVRLILPRHHQENYSIAYLKKNTRKLKCKE